MTREEMVEKYVAQYGEPYRIPIAGGVDWYFMHKHLWDEWAIFEGRPYSVDKYMEELLRSVCFDDPAHYYQFPPDPDEEEE